MFNIFKKRKKDEVVFKVCLENKGQPIIVAQDLDHYEAVELAEKFNSNRLETQTRYYVTPQV